MDYIDEDWMQDIIIGMQEKPISRGVKTLFHLFEEGVFNQRKLPMQGKRKPNGHQEKRGKQVFKRTIKERDQEHPNYRSEFGHLEGDTIIGNKHKSAVITLVERVRKCIITLKPVGRKAENIEKTINDWLKNFPGHLFKSITFDCEKAFSNWKNVSNEHDME